MNKTKKTPSFFFNSTMLIIHMRPRVKTIYCMNEKLGRRGEKNLTDYESHYLEPGEINIIIQVQQ